MPALDMLAVSLVPERRPNDVLTTAWMPDTDSKDFVELVRSHFKAKDIVYLFRDKFSISVIQLCRKLSNRVSGELSHMQGETVSKDLVVVSAKIRLTPEQSSHTSLDATMATITIKDRNLFIPVSICGFCESYVLSCTQSLNDQDLYLLHIPVVLQHSSVGNMNDDDPMKKQCLLAIDCTFQMISNRPALSSASSERCRGYSIWRGGWSRACYV